MSASVSRAIQKLFQFFRTALPSAKPFFTNLDTKLGDSQTLTFELLFAVEIRSRASGLPTRDSSIHSNKRHAAERMPGTRHSRNWSEFPNSRRRQSWESFWKLVSCSRSNQTALPAGPPLLYYSLLSAGVARRPTFPCPLISHSPFVVSLRMADALAGVTLTIGTDAPLVAYGTGLHDEFGHFLKAGFTPVQILALDTRNSASYLGRSDTLGQIAPGFEADGASVPGNPLKNIGSLRQPTWVMLRGQIVVRHSRRK